MHAKEDFVKHAPRSSGTPANLSGLMQQRLNMYALAASAAGVGVFALSQAAEAKIVYTPVQRVIGVNQTIPIDLNHDGKTDFSLQNLADTFESTGQGFLNALPARQSNGVDGFGSSLFRRPYGFALKAGNRVGPKAQFVFGKYIYMLYANATRGCHGSWNDVKNRYLGLQFTIKGKTHYGWARLNVSCDTLNRRVSAVLTGYAYETVPNKAIVTGKTKGPKDVSDLEPPTPEALRSPAREPAGLDLGLLAMGAPAFSIWRQQESVGIPQ